MPDLLHEFWRTDDSGDFGLIRVNSDKVRAQIYPEATFQFEIWAPSWREAMRLYEERAYREFGKPYDHFPDTIYSEEDLAEQRAYLRVRTVARPAPARLRRATRPPEV